MPTTSNGAVSVVAALRERYCAWRALEDLAQILGLDWTFRVSAPMALLGRVIVLDPSLPPEESTRQFARAIARYVLRDGGCCSEAQLALELERSVARPRSVGRLVPAVGALRRGRRDLCAL